MAPCLLSRPKMSHLQLGGQQEIERRIISNMAESIGLLAKEDTNIGPVQTPKMDFIMQGVELTSCQHNHILVLHPAFNIENVISYIHSCRHSGYKFQSINLASRPAFLGRVFGKQTSGFAETLNFLLEFLSFFSKFWVFPF